MSKTGIHLRNYHGLFDLSHILENEPPSVDTVVSSLNSIFRFTGHAYYTVNQHELALHDFCQKYYPQLAPFALVHDSHEAFVGDISRPLKNVLGIEFEATLNKITDTIDDFLLDEVFKWDTDWTKELSIVDMATLRKLDSLIAEAELQVFFNNEAPSTLSIANDMIPFVKAKSTKFALEIYDEKLYYINHYAKAKTEDMLSLWDIGV